MNTMSNDTLKHKTYLAVGYDERAQAQQEIGRLSNGVAGISFDGEQGLWYAKAGVDKHKAAPWLPDPTLLSQHQDSDPVVEFANVLESAGLVLKEPPIMDGQMHRVPTLDDKQGKKSGVYALYNDGHPAGWYQDHRNHSEPQKWHASFEQADPLTRLHQKAHMANLRWQREQNLTTKQQHHAKRCAQAYGLMPVANPQQGYLKKKGVQAYAGVCQDKKGRLMIPLYDTEQQIHSLQRISGNGFKCLKKGAQKSGHFFVVGDRPLNADEPILYAEGYATAASIAEATGRSVVMTVDAGNMPKVAEKVNAAYPKAKHLFLADNDHSNQINKGMQKAREAANLVGGFWLTPNLSAEEMEHGLTDFNDLHVTSSIERVKKQIESYLDKCWPELKYQRPERLLPGLNSVMPDSIKTQSVNNKVVERVAPSRQPETTATTKTSQLQNQQTNEPIKSDEKPLLPEQLSSRYTFINGKGYFASRPSAVAFIDKGNKLQTRLEHSKVVMDLITIAKHRGWHSIKLKGSQNFKQEAWYQAKLKGLEVTGYQPQSRDHQRLAQQQAKSQKQQTQQLVSPIVNKSINTKPSTQTKTNVTQTAQSALERFKQRFSQPNTISKSRVSTKKEAQYEQQLER